MGWTGRNIVLIFALVIGGMALAGCEQKTAAQPDAATRLQSVAAADPTKYPALEQGKHWSNPYLVIGPAQVGLLTDVTSNEERMLKPAEVLNVLAQLPAAAWPYGRAVAILVDEKQASSEADKVAQRRNRGIVEGDLEAAHVAVRWIPSP